MNEQTQMLEQIEAYFQELNEKMNQPADCRVEVNGSFIPMREVDLEIAAVVMACLKIVNRMSDEDAREHALFSAILSAHGNQMERITADRLIKTAIIWQLKTKNEMPEYYQSFQKKCVVHVMERVIQTA